MTGAALRRLPGLRALSGYQRSWLQKDLVAGLVLTSLLVPQGMAYAELAGLPAITGLYTSVLCLIGYALFGPSRILVLGPGLVARPDDRRHHPADRGLRRRPEARRRAGVDARADGRRDHRRHGVARLGFIADLLSKPTQIGYMNGLALTILVGQLPKLFGFSVDGDGLIDEARGFVNGVTSGETVGAAVAIGLLGLVLILVLQRLLPQVPGVLVAVVVSIAAASCSTWRTTASRSSARCPRGCRRSRCRTRIGDLPVLLGGALGIALVSLTDTISTSSAFAARTGQEVNGNGEMIGIGAANLAAAFFQGFPVSTSGSRTAVAEQAGAKTQVTGLVGAAAILLMLVLVPGLLRNLPQPTLAAVVIAASLSLADLAGTVRLLAPAAHRVPALDRRLPRRGAARRPARHRRRRRAVDPERLPPLLVAVPDNARARPRPARLPRRRRSIPRREELPGLVIFRFDAPLFFANARTFSDQIRRLARTEPRPRWILVAAEPITDVDTTAADMLADLDEELNAAGTSLVFAELKETVRAKLERYELIGPLDPAHFFPTLDAAVEEFRAVTGADWSPPAELVTGAPS